MILSPRCRWTRSFLRKKVFEAKILTSWYFYCGSQTRQIGIKTELLGVTKYFFLSPHRKQNMFFFKASFHIHSLKKSLFFNCFVFDGGLSSKIIKALEAIKSHEKTWKSSAEKPQTDIIASHTHFELSSREIIAFSHAT